MMNDKESRLLTASQYFLSRKKEIERYVEGEHKWYGDVSEVFTPTMNVSPRPWYLDKETVLSKSK